MGAQPSRVREEDHQAPSANGTRAFMDKLPFKISLTPIRKRNRRRSLVHPPPLTEEQKGLIIHTWTILKQDIAKVGVAMFIGLFETHPEAQDIFLSFKGIPHKELRDNPQLRSHSLRVLGTVDKVVSRINDEEKIAAVLLELGKKHKAYNAHTDFLEVSMGIDYMGEAFIFALKPAIADVWTTDVEKAWRDAFQLIIYYMKKGLLSAT
ncbi:uncharacterized protein LOC135485475 [Lineus longissimus]|uniref:uncharacterized protein LOC135485475 n=1 Tax=Lineus longissimus TaxID=88925 RepID=UPI00315D94B6